MPPKQDKSSADRAYGLSDAEMKTCICVLRLLVVDGNTPIDKVALAKLTGHDKPNSAVKIWSNARAKLAAAHAGGTSDNATDDEAAAMAPAIKPAKRGRPANKTKAGKGKKVAAVVDDEEEEEDHDDDDLKAPAPKRSKGITKREAEDNSV
ncbi:hypothetical protein N0V93_009678 [Gnomoniopsis smithogilvyi]|uniref:Uncharacterized protein n=1 Tax=Gnomoniopsis smithogilvyi TaxID=1191159 RepID=A0A9W8YNA2_9PEZI|nr:hypothetical protein N0V93_009678 [Gnomoniopsis smithogilvyi]